MNNQECVQHPKRSSWSVTSQLGQPVASIAPNLESKSGATFSLQFWAEVPPISDSSFLFYFGLLPLWGKSFP